MEKKSAMSDMEWVYIGLGANLGSPVRQIEGAIVELREFGSLPSRISSFWASEAADSPYGSPDYVNAVMGMQLDASIDPQGFLGHLFELESLFGIRDRTVRNNPRYMDLDILLWGNRQLETIELTLPHPRARERSFVMRPLAEIAPDLKWPGTDETVARLAAQLGNDDLWRI